MDPVREISKRFVAAEDSKKINTSPPPFLTVKYGLLW